jgi:dynein heavy chain
MRLVGNCSLATAFISYCGPFNSDFRMHLATDKFIVDMKQRNIPVLPSLANELTSFLVDDATVGEWNLQGLPKDDLSIQNGIMVTNSTRYPLLIDPQGQGQNWIMKKYADSMDKYRSLANLNNPKFKDFFLKYCLEEGKTIVIEGIENEVDPVLDPVLEKQVIWKKSRGLIKIGGTDMDFNKNFLMFITCRLPNPSFSPELSAKTTIIDFTVTQKGLEQQLLGKVISKEQKALEDSLNALLTDVNNNKKELQKLDKNLLQRLTESKGNLLDDTELMEVLNSTKTQAKEVAVKLTDAEIKTKEINDKREQYRPVAIRGAALYFTMIEVSLVNWMYNSSLEQFLVLFNESIDQSDKAQSPSKRVDIIIKFLTKHAYKYVNRGLFEKDKITFVLMMCFKILITAGKINSNDVGLFLKAGAAEDIKSKPKPTGNQFSFISEKAWLNIIAFSKHCFNDAPVATFKELPELIVKNQPGWQAFFEKNDPENAVIPDLTERLGQEKEENRAFMQLCLLRSVREDRTLVASSAFINAVLGT